MLFNDKGEMRKDYIDMMISSLGKRKQLSDPEEKLLGVLHGVAFTDRSTGKHVNIISGKGVGRGRGNS